MKSSVASSSFSDSIVSWMTKSSCSSALDNAILQLALHTVHLDTERSLSSQFGHDLRRRTGYLLSLCSNHALVALDRTTAQCSSHPHRPHACYSEFRIPDNTGSASRFTRKRDHHSAQQLMLFTVVAVVVTGTLGFFTVSLSLSLFAPVLGSGPVVYLQALFRAKDGPRRRPTHSLHTAFAAAPHTAHLASRTRSCKFTLHSATARRIGDVASKRLEYPPLASVCVLLLTDGSRALPSA